MREFVMARILIIVLLLLPICARADDWSGMNISNAAGLRQYVLLHDITPSYGATMPVVAGGILYVRDDDRLLCYAVRKAQLTDSNAVPDRVHLVAPRDPPHTQPRVIRSVFVSTPELVVTKMLELAKIKPTDRVCDLGSGDGRILITAAKQYGCRAEGYEIDPQLVELARASVQQAELENLVMIHQRDMLTADLRAADVVTLYLVPEQLAALVPQLKKLKTGSRIVSHQFPIPGTEPDKIIELRADSLDGQHTLYLWTVPFK